MVGMIFPFRLLGRFPFQRIDIVIAAVPLEALEIHDVTTVGAVDDITGLSRPHRKEAALIVESGHTKTTLSRRRVYEQPDFSIDETCDRSSCLVLFATAHWFDPSDSHTDLLDRGVPWVPCLRNGD